MSALEQVRALRPHFDEVAVCAGQTIATEGSLCHQFFVVADGTLETCRHGRRGVLVAGEAFGWEAMRNRGLNDASVKALTDARLLVMGHAQFRAITALAGDSGAGALRDGSRYRRGSSLQAAGLGQTRAS